MHESLFSDQARLEDPHLWERAQYLGLDLERFDADRRDPDTIARVSGDFRSGVRAGVVTTPTLIAAGVRLVGRIAESELRQLLEPGHARSI